MRIAGIVAGALALAACQQANEEAIPAEQAPAQLPDRPDGANTILTQPLTVAEGVEAIVQDAIFPPNAELSAHYHPGEEVLYMLEGTVELFEDGAAPITLSAGDAHVITAGLVHHAKAGPLGARAAIFRAHVTGEPVRIDAKDDGGME